MKLTARFILVFIFQLNALNALAGMVEMNHSNIDNATIAETQNIEVDNHCDVAEGTIDHCHCTICFAVIESESIESESGSSQLFFARLQGPNHPSYGIYKPPQ